MYHYCYTLWTSIQIHFNLFALTFAVNLCHVIECRMCCVAGDLYSDRWDNSNCRCFCWRRSHWLTNVHRHSIHMDFGRCFVTMIHGVHRSGMVSAEPVDLDCLGAAMVAAIQHCYSWRNSVRVLDYRNQIRHCVLCVRVCRWDRIHTIVFMYLLCVCVSECVSVCNSVQISVNHPISQRKCARLQACTTEKKFKYAQGLLCIGNEVG